MRNFGIKPVLWEYKCDEEYLEEFSMGKIVKYSLLLAVLDLDFVAIVFYFGSS